MSAIVWLATPVGIVGIGVFRSWGLIADVPMWVYTLVLVLGQLMTALAAWYVRGREHEALAVHARVAVSVAVTSVTTYLAGWGSVLVLAYALIIAELLRTVGRRALHPSLCWTIGAVTTGETLVHLRIVPSFLTIGQSHAGAVVSVLLLLAVTRILGDFVTVTEEAEEVIARRARHYEQLVAHARDVIGVLAPDGTIRSISPAVTDMLGFRPEDVIGRHVADFVDPATTHAVLDALAHAAANVGAVLGQEVTVPDVHGVDRRVEVSFSCPAADWRGDVVVNMHDVTTQRALESQLRHDARHDVLTGLLNRKAFSEVSERVCSRAAAAGGAVGMLYVDLDGFKDVNDSYGHDAGDRVLRDAARRIARCLRPGETLARLGGDEFAILLDEPAPGRPARLADHLIEALGAPVEGFPSEVRVGASVGIALRTSDGIEMSTLLLAADAAMYAAKRTGRRRWVMDEPTVDA